MTSVEKLLRWIAIGGVFLLPFIPLIVTTSMYFPYITGKNFAFRAIVEVSFCAYLALALINARYAPRRSWILAAFAAFVFVIAIADAQGVNVFKSFWSNFERMDGWVTLAHLLALLAVAANAIDTEKLWRRLFQLSIAVSVLVSLLGFQQLIFGSGASGGGLANRIDATFGNPIYLAIYMLFHMFFAALLWTQAWNTLRTGKRLPVSLWYGFVICLDGAALVLTGTRGTILGLIGGVILSACIMVLLARRSRAAWRLSVGAIVALLTLSAGFWAVHDTAFVRSIGPLERLSTLSLTDATVHARFLNMGIAWQGVKERPILGWGQENYAIVFDKYYDPRMLGQEPWFDRVHDSIFDWLIAGGVVGLAAYLAIFVALLVAVWRRVGAGKEAPFDVYEGSIITGLIAAYFFHNLFVFDNVTSYILFAMLAAYVMWRRAAARDAGAVTSFASMRRYAPIIAVVALAASGVLVWAINAPGYRQNLTLLDALKPQAGGLSQNLALFERSIAYGAMGTQEAREQFIQAAAQVAGASSVDAATRQAFAKNAAIQMQEQEKVSPLDARFPLFLGSLYRAYGMYDLSLAAFEKAHELSPRKQTILYEIGSVELAHGEKQKALDAFRAAYELDTSIADARITYATALVSTGDLAAADPILAPLVPTGEAADIRVAQAYAQQKRFDKIVAIWKARVQAVPSDPQGYFTLAAGYYGTGDKEHAIEALRGAQQADPSTTAQVEQLVEEIQKGTAQI